jgi:hypothetical protein
VLLYEQRHVHDKRDARTECDEQPEDDIRKDIVNDGRAELAQRRFTVEDTVNHPMVRDRVNCEIV